MHQTPYFKKLNHHCVFKEKLSYLNDEIGQNFSDNNFFNYNVNN